MGPLVLAATMTALVWGELLSVRRRHARVPPMPPFQEEAMTITRAISIRQPWVELILRGEKRAEYRSRPTRIRERVYLYASIRPADYPPAWRRIGKEPGELPTGVILGSVEIVGCRWDRRLEAFAYVLERPIRLRRPRAVKNQPQPVFWRPQFRT